MRERYDADVACAWSAHMIEIGCGHSCLKTRQQARQRGHCRSTTSCSTLKANDTFSAHRVCREWQNDIHHWDRDVYWLSRRVCRAAAGGRAGPLLVLRVALSL